MDFAVPPDGSRPARPVATQGGPPQDLGIHPLCGDFASLRYSRGERIGIPRKAVILFRCRSPETMNPACAAIAHSRAMLSWGSS